MSNCIDFHIEFLTPVLPDCQSCHILIENLLFCLFLISDVQSQLGPDLEVGGFGPQFGGGSILEIYFTFSWGKMTICPNAHNYGPPQAKISTICSAASKILDDFWLRWRKLRQFLVP